jgi:hypothetical protein
MARASLLDLAGPDHEWFSSRCVLAANRIMPMTASDTPSVPAPAAPGIAYPAPVDPSKRFSIFAILAFVLGAFLAVSFTSVKIMSVSTVTLPEPDVLDNVMGVLGLASIVVIAATIVLGHLGLRGTKASARRGNMLAIAGLTLGYFFLLLYFNRIIVAIIASITPNGNSDFLTNIYFWV